LIKYYFNQGHKLNIAVTGAAGFLGHHLCKRLLDNGHNVLALDNFLTGSEYNLHTHPNYKFIKFDIVKDSWSSLDKIDFIYNLACPASPIHYQRWSLETLDACYIGVRNLLKFALDKRIPVLHTSTSEVYGDPEVSPQSEDYRGVVNCYGRRACYDEGKRVAEAIIYEHRHIYNQKIHTVRIFNTYGPNMAVEDGRIISNFVVQALKGQPITIYGDGSQTRSFCWVGDMVDGLLSLSSSEVYDPTNIGNDTEYTILEVAKLIVELTGSQSEIVFRPLPEDDPKQRRPDITKAAKLLNWRPVTSLQDGLVETIKYFRNHV
jgi:UDP-glucuronate decarboxylase